MNQEEFEALQKKVKARLKEQPRIAHSDKRPVFLTYANRTSTPGAWVTSLRLKAVDNLCPRTGQIRIYAILRDTFFRIEDDPNRRNILQRLLYDIRREVWRNNRVVEVISDDEENESGNKTKEKSEKSVKCETNSKPAEGSNQDENSKLKSSVQENSKIGDRKTFGAEEGNSVNASKESDLDISKTIKSREEDNHPLAAKSENVIERNPQKDENGGGCKPEENRVENESKTGDKTESSEVNSGDDNGRKQKEVKNEENSRPEKNDGNECNQETSESNNGCRPQEGGDTNRTEPEKSGDRKQCATEGCVNDIEAAQEDYRDNEDKSKDKQGKTGEKNLCQQENSPVEGGCNLDKSAENKAMTPENSAGNAAKPEENVDSECKPQQSGVEDECKPAENSDENECKVEEVSKNMRKISGNLVQGESKDDKENGCNTKSSEVDRKENYIAAPDHVSKSVEPIENILEKLKIS